jgi:hypothetical protein
LTLTIDRRAGQTLHPGRDTSLTLSALSGLSCYQ